MKKAMDSNISLLYREDLMTRYEELRTLALKKVSPFSNSPLGFSIFLFRGMISWVETLSSEFINVPQKNFTYFQAQTISNISQSSKIYLAQPIQEEATRLLANMVMYQQKEKGQRYV